MAYRIDGLLTYPQIKEGNPADSGRRNALDRRTLAQSPPLRCCFDGTPVGRSGSFGQSIWEFCERTIMAVLGLHKSHIK